jgi:hypothetical protein
MPNRGASPRPHPESIPEDPDEPAGPSRPASAIEFISVHE